MATNDKISTRTNPAAAAKAGAYAAKAGRENSAVSANLKRRDELNRAGLGTGRAVPKTPAGGSTPGPSPIQQQTARRVASQARLAASRAPQTASAPSPAPQGGLAQLLSKPPGMKCGGKVKGK